MTAAKKITYADRPFQASFEGRNLRCYADNVLVLMDHHRDARDEKRTTGGIIIVHDAREPGPSEAVRATVVAVGPGRYDDVWLGQEQGTAQIGSSKFIPSELKAGDRILLQGPLCGDQLVLDGVEHRVVREEVVLGVLEDGE